MLKAVIDRFEDGKAVLLLGEDEEAQVNFPKEYLPEDAAEGDYLQINIEVDEAATAQAMEEARQLLNDLKED